MTVFNHGTQAGLIQFAICTQLNADVHVTLWTVIGAVFLAIYPDIERLFQEDTNDWTTYNKLHVVESWWFMPYWNLHIIEDAFAHDKNGKWKPWVMPVEIISDVVFLIIILKILL